MATLSLKITNAGLAAVQGASGSDPTVIAALGLSATAFDYAPTLTALPGEFKRLDVASGVAAAPNVTHLTAYDTSADTWAATSFGLYLDDGTLFAVHAGAATVMNKAAVAWVMLGCDIAFNADLAANIAFGDVAFAYPPATEEMRGVAELATPEEAAAGEDASRIVTPASAKSAVTDWLFRRSVRLGQAVVETPNAGSSGGLRLCANPDTGDAYLQAISFDLQVEMGHFRFSPGGAADWNGDGGLLDNGHKVWNSGNDGDGSTLEADLLDGYHAADLLPTGDLSAAGYCRLPNGLILQWGTITVGDDAYGTLTFPIQFPNACFYIGSGVATEVGVGNAQANCPLPYAVSQTGASFYNAAPIATAWWLALGR